MSDSEYTESLEAGQEESEENERRIAPENGQQQQQLLFQQQHQNTFMQYAGSTSSSGDDSSVSSSSSDDSSDGQADTEDSWELTKITEDVLNLPRGLCENPAIFHEFFSLDTWQDLPPQMQNHLQQFLPDFGKANLSPQLVAVEKARTLSMLFNGTLKRFEQTPMVQLQRQLEAGNYRPDIRKLKDNIVKSQRREKKFQLCEQVSQMAKQLFLSRQRLLDHAQKSLPEISTKVPQSANTTTVVSNSSKSRTKPINLYRDNKLSAIRARKRFFSEITQISQQLGIPDSVVLSADEDDDAMDRLLDDDMKRDLLQQQRIVEQEHEAAAAKPNIPMAERCVYSTLFRKRNDCEDEFAFRLQQKNRQTRLTNSNFKEYLREHKRRKITEPTLPEFETSDIRLRDVCGRAQIGGNFKRMFGTGKTPGRKPKITAATANTASLPTNNIEESSSNSAIPANIMTLQQQQQQPSQTHSPLPFPAATAILQQIHQPLHHRPTLPPPPPKLSEPPALVPIQPIIKKTDPYHQQLTAGNIHTPPRTQTEHSTPLDMNVFHKTNNNNSSDALNISSFMSTHPDLCIDDTSLLSGDHDTFNMLDSEVELQQEEVETFANSSDDNLTNFVIGDDIVLGSRNDTSITSLLQATHKNDRVQHITASTSSPQPLPKLEPIMRNNSDLTQKQTNKINFQQKPSPTTALPIAVNCASELIQETHACYFSLIRDFFCSTQNHRMRYEDLKSKIDTWLRNPITALNEWYAMAENWSNLLRSAVNFLLGDFPGMNEDYVPYIEHKVQLNIYQWIGAGRDSDNKLVDLCSSWMEKRKLPNDLRHQQQNQKQQQQLLLETKLQVVSKSVVETDEYSAENGNVQTPPPPPPRCPTNWTVRAATDEEIEEFQRQERERFEQPHKSYTYRMYGYESVVSPVKGIYTPMLALSKPRGHSMMVENRPNFVTILTLVRDATARLPNGEGTRADISEMLKCSQYINQDAAENVLQSIVSGALDRMHTEPDPCVRYDPKKKIWIYLHRDRSEEDFERIHQQNHNVGKTKKVPQQRKQKPIVQAGNSKLSSSENESNSTTPHTMDIANGQSLITLPALVPAKPMVLSNATAARSQAIQNQHIQVSKCPPVPPLKYNVPQQQQQQQRSLLKSAARLENKSNPQSASSQISKQQHQFQIPANKSSSPIIVATPQILQHTNSNNNSSNQYQSNSVNQQTNLTANLAGKRVMLNNPIIINQITTQQQKMPSVGAKMKSTQQLLKHQQGRVHRLSPQQQQQMQQQLQSNVITIPISMANNLNINAPTTAEHQSLESQQQQQPSGQTTLGNKPNIIRVVPASNVKTVLSSTTTQQMGNRQSRIVATTNAERPKTPHQAKPNSSIQQLFTNNGNVITVNSGTGTIPINTVSGGSIVKMTPQAFTALQQKQTSTGTSTAVGQKPHFVVKQGSSQAVAKAPHQLQITTGTKGQRIILGNSAVMGQPVVQGKNIVFQQIAMSSPSIVNASSTNTTTNASSSNTITGNKVQVINTTNLTPQQQRILIQNLKQQQQQQQTPSINQNQIQFKTVQVMANNNAVTQHVNQRTSQSITLATSATASPQTTSKSMVAALPSQNMGAAPQQTNLTRILRTSPQLKSEVSTTSNVGNRVITNSSGQIISLDSLIQKQGGALRISGTGGTSGILKTTGNQQTATSVFQKATTTNQQKQQPQQQFSIVSVPNSIISLGNSNFTVGQRIITTQAATNTIVNTANVDGTRISPAVTSSAQRGVVTSSANSKMIAKSTVGGGTGGNIRVVNQTGGINLATLQGKQVILTPGKPMNTINKAQMANTQQQQSNILQTVSGGSIVIGGQTIKLQQGNPNIQQIINKSGNIISTQPASSNQATGTTGGQMQTVIMGNQVLRVQQMPQIVTAGGNRVTTNKVASNSIGESGGSIVTTNVPKTIFVGASGQALRLQHTSSSASSSIAQTANKNIIVNTNQHQNVIASTIKTAANSSASQPNRVVLAVQGGGQIFLSPNIQGGNLNLKSLQGLKMVSLAQPKDRQIAVSAISPAAPNVNIIKTSSITSSNASDGNL